MNFMLSIFTLLLGASCLAFSSLSAPAVALPATLKPEPHQRDPYDWNARHEAVKRTTQSLFMDRPGMKPLKEETGR